MNSFNLYYLLRGSISKYSYMGSLGFNLQIWEGGQNSVHSKDQYENVHSNFTQSGLKLEIIQCSSAELINKYLMAQSRDGKLDSKKKNKLLTHRRAWIVLSYMVMSKSSHKPGLTYCMDPFTGSSRTNKG